MFSRDALADSACTHAYMLTCMHFTFPSPAPKLAMVLNKSSVLSGYSALSAVRLAGWYKLESLAGNQAVIDLVEAECPPAKIYKS